MTKPDLRCTKCGYDLTGCGPICPECGRLGHWYTDRARILMSRANEAAIRYYKNTPPFPDRFVWFLPSDAFWTNIRPFHLLLGLIYGADQEQGDGIALAAIRSTGHAPLAIATTAITRLPRVMPRSIDADIRLPLSIHTKRVINQATDEAMALGHRWIGTEHVLLSLLAQPDEVTAVACKAHDIYYHTMRDWIAANASAVARE